MQRAARRKTLQDSIECSQQMIFNFQVGNIAVAL